MNPAQQSSSAAYAHTVLDRLERDASPIDPPAVPYKRARQWRIFEKTFRPIPAAGGNTVWNGEDLPPGIDSRHLWSVYQHMTGSGAWHLRPGKRGAPECQLGATMTSTANRVGFIVTAHPWGGMADDHPDYVY